MRTEESEELPLILTQSLLARERPGEGDTVRPAGGDVEGREVRIVPGHRDGPTLGVDGLGGVAGSARLRVAMLLLGQVSGLRSTIPAVQDNVVNSFINWSQCDVVIQKLSKLHQHQSVTRVQIGHISVDNNGD